MNHSKHQNINEQLTCPACRASMQHLNLAGRASMVHLTTHRRAQDAVTVDLCFACQGIWFDSYESTRIAPNGILELFRLIHEHRHDPREQLRASLRCPRCAEKLVHSQDIGQSGRFNYYRCEYNHGRFTPFAQLMIEKGFVRQLTPVEIHTIAAQISNIQCHSCGAPVDIRHDSSCPHCRSAISILDPNAVEKALSQYHQQTKLATMRSPLDIAEALLTNERTHRQQAKMSSQTQEIPGNLIASSIELVCSLLSD